jgi:glycosyltransferase involved in cell wall biosynthesis
MLLDNPFINDRRVHREAKFLVDKGNQVYMICLKTQNVSDSEIVDGINVFRILDDRINKVQDIQYVNKVAQIIISEFSFDIVHAHDQVMLNIGVKIKKLKPKVKLIYDSHELFYRWPLNTNASLWIVLKSLIVRKLLIKREKENFKSINGLITVNESIENDLSSRFNLSIPTTSIRNIPELPQNLIKCNILREIFNIPLNTKILVYIGANVYPKTINIEQVLDEFKNEENVVLVFICQKNWGQKAVESYCNNNNIKNVYFHDIISPNSIPKYLSSADVGIVSSWNKKDLSYWYGLDNKLFEYMMSEIPILATQQPEYIKVVDNYKIGICVNPDEPGAYIEGFKNILEKKDFFINNIKQTKPILNWNKESEKLDQFYKSILDLNL